MVPRLRSRSQAAPKLSQLTQGTEPAARPREARHPRKGRARQLAVPASSSPVSSPSRQSSSPVCSPSWQSSSAVGLAVLAKLKSRGPRGHREGQGPRSPSRKASPVELVVPVKASGAPGRGRRRAARHSWLPSVHLLCQSGWPSHFWRPHLAWHASRGWSRVGTWLPCPDAQTSVPPF